MQQTQKTKDIIRQVSETLTLITADLARTSAANSDTSKLKVQIDSMERCLQQLRNAVWRNDVSVLLSQQSSN